MIARSCGDGVPGRHGLTGRRDGEGCSPSALRRSASAPIAIRARERRTKPLAKPSDTRASNRGNSRIGTSALPRPKIGIALQQRDDFTRIGCERSHVAEDFDVGIARRRRVMTAQHTRRPDHDERPLPDASSNVWSRLDFLR